MILRILTLSALLFSVISCQPEESQTEYTIERTEQFTPATGSYITNREAQSMTARYREEYPEGPRAFYVPRATVESMIQSPAVAGISFYKGLDATGIPFLVLIGINENGKEISNGRVARSLSGEFNCQQSGICPEGTMNLENYTRARTKKVQSAISLESARMATFSFQQAYPKRQFSFYFGKDIITQLINTDEVTGIDAYAAMNANRSDEILLSAARNAPAHARFVAAEEMETADRSTICPPYCSLDSELINKDNL